MKNKMWILGFVAIFALANVSAATDSVYDMSAESVMCQQTLLKVNAGSLIQFYLPVGSDTYDEVISMSGYSETQYITGGVESIVWTPNGNRKTITLYPGVYSQTTAPRAKVYFPIAEYVSMKTQKGYAFSSYIGTAPKVVWKGMVPC